MPKRKPFTIAHLSDLHLTKKDSASRSSPKLFGRLKGMNAAFRKIVKSRVLKHSDVILVTGDVTDRGDLEAWGVFWEALSGAGLKERTLVVPGNHDVCCLGARFPPQKGNPYSDKILQQAVTGLRMGNQKFKFPWVVTPDPRVAIFGLNSNNLGNWLFTHNALGELGYHQLVSLASKLHKHREVPVKIVALHHSPNIPEVDTAIKRGQRPIYPVDRKASKMQREQRRTLRLLCIAQGVRLIAHGHIHILEDRRVTGVHIVGTPATTEPIPTKKGQAYRFFTYRVSGDSGRVRTIPQAVDI